MVAILTHPYTLKNIYKLFPNGVYNWYGFANKLIINIDTIWLFV